MLHFAMSMSALSRDTETEAGFRDALVAQAERKRAHLRALVEQRRQIDLEWEQLRRYIDELNHTLRAEGLEIIDTSQDIKPRTGFAAPGNRSGNMPPRREPFVATSLTEAVKMLLAHHGQMHADELVNAIFDIKDRRGFLAAKQNLGSTLSRMAKKGSWKRGTRPNTYRPNDEEGNPANT